MTKAGTFVAQYGSRRTVGVLRKGGWLRALLSGCALPLGFALLSGCTLHMYSPPARLAPTELSTNMEKGEFEIIANAGAHADLAFNPVAPAHAQGSVAYGLSDQAAVQGSVSYVRVRGQDDFDHRVNQNIVAARVGFGYSPIMPRQWLRFTFGMGGGSSAAGGFFSPDIGVNLSYDNRFLVPFFNLSFWISFPGENAQVRLRYRGDLDTAEVDQDGESIEESGARMVNVPVETTTGRVISLGVALRLGGWSRRIDWAAGESPRGPALVFAVQEHRMRDVQESVAFLGMTGGIMYRF